MKIADEFGKLVRADIEKNSHKHIWVGIEDLWIHKGNTLMECQCGQRKTINDILREQLKVTP